MYIRLHWITQVENIISKTQAHLHHKKNKRRKMTPITHKQTSRESMIILIIDVIHIH